jgi:hypothetical protein
MDLWKRTDPLVLAAHDHLRAPPALARPKKSINRTLMVISPDHVCVLWRQCSYLRATLHAST